MSAIGFSEIETLMRAKAHTEQLPVGSRALDVVLVRARLVCYARTHFDHGVRRPSCSTHVYRCTCVVRSCAALPHVCRVLRLCRRLRRVRAAAQAENVQGSVQAARVDLDGVVSRCQPGQLLGRQHAQRPLLDDVPRLARHLQRLHGLRVWLLLWPHAAHSTLAQEDLGGLHWRRSSPRIVWAMLFASQLAQYDAIVCPRSDPWSWPTTCDRNPVFDVQEIALPERARHAALGRWRSRPPP
jgi:hypothetical protein